MSFSEKVHQLRRGLKLTQRQLAEQAVITQATLSRIENGKASNLRPNTLIKLATVLNVTIDYLIGKTDKLTADDIILSDSNARLLINCFSSIPVHDKKELIDYARFLSEANKSDDEIAQVSTVA